MNKGTDLLQLWLQGVKTGLMWVLGTEPWSLRRAELSHLSSPSLLYWNLLYRRGYSRTHRDLPTFAGIESMFLYVSMIPATEQAVVEESALEASVATEQDFVSRHTHTHTF